MLIQIQIILGLGTAEVLMSILQIGTNSKDECYPTSTETEGFFFNTVFLMHLCGL